MMSCPFLAHILGKCHFLYLNKDFVLEGKWSIVNMTMLSFVSICFREWGPQPEAFQEYKQIKMKTDVIKMIIPKSMVKLLQSEGISLDQEEFP